MNPRYRVPVSVLALLVSNCTCATVFTVGPPGTQGSCTHTTLQAAVNAAAAAPGPDQIYVSRNGANGYTAQAVVIEEQSVHIIGGFADCFPLAPTGITRLSGSGGVAAPVISVLHTTGAPVSVQLDRLEIVNGDNTMGFAYGGGIRVNAPVQLSLSNLRIANNNAYYGAGIAIQGYPDEAQTRVDIGNNVQIEDNATVGPGGGVGGGIYASKAYVRLGGIDTVVRRNSAGSGGGIRIEGMAADLRASLDVTSGGQGTDAVIADNTVSNAGGGLFAGDFATVTMFTTDAARPVRLARNRANYAGGLYAYGSATRVTLWEAVVDANQGRYNGGALGVADGAEVALYPVQTPGAPPGTVACPAAEPCNLLGDNRAGDTIAGEGAVAVLKNSQSGTLSLLILNSVNVTGNNGNSLFTEACDAPPTPCGHPALISIVNSRIAPNFDASMLLSAYRGGTELRCDLCTIASTGGNAGVPLIESNGVVNLSRSILWEPGRDIIGSSFQPAVLAYSLLLHDAIDFAGQNDIRVGDPRFVAQGAGDFRLATNSPALDSADATDVTPYDLDGNARVADQPGIPDRLGPTDLGAYERGGDADVIFVYGFE